MSQAATHSSADITAPPSMALRQPNVSAAMRSGAPAPMAPRMPVNSDRPDSMAKRDGANQCAASLSMATKATPTDAPTSRRPSPASA
jgi:hypothetical protein